MEKKSMKLRFMEGMMGFAEGLVKTNGSLRQFFEDSNSFTKALVNTIIFMYMLPMLAFCLLLNIVIKVACAVNVLFFCVKTFIKYIINSRR